MGDGENGTGGILTHTYPAAGVYTAVITASNPVSVVTAATAVTILSPCEAVGGVDTLVK